MPMQKGKLSLLMWQIYSAGSHPKASVDGTCSRLDTVCKFRKDTVVVRWHGSFLSVASVLAAMENGVFEKGPPLGPKTMSPRRANIEGSPHKSRCYGRLQTSLTGLLDDTTN